MRINLIIILMTSFLLQVSAGSFAQKITLNEKNASFEAIINKIQAQSGYDFIGNTVLIRTAKPVSINVKEISLAQALELCFANQDLSYTLKDKTVVIKHKQASIFDKVVDFFTAIEIRGKVLDEKGNPLAGASIKVKGSDKGTVSNSNGEFLLENLNENAILQIHFVGYITKEITAKVLKENPVVRLEINTGELNEVAVVSTGYQKIPTEQLTGSTSTINKKAYESPIITNNFLQGLQNKLPGVLINGDLKFEGNSLFQIRGISTISATKQPLVVVDGYPTELSLDAINPNEIESVTVLKDAAAAAIYGVRASNGVIIVERKKAVKGDAKFEFRSTLSVTSKEDYTTYRLAPNTARMNYRIDSYDRTGSQNRDYFTNNPGRYNGGDEPLIDLASGLITRAEMEKRMAEQYAYDNKDDYSRFFEQNKVTQQYDFNFSGGTEKALYYISSNLTRNQNSKIKSNDQRFLLSGRGTYNFNDKLSFVLTTDFMQNKGNGTPVYNYTDFYSFERFQDDNGTPLSTFAGSPTNPLYNPGIIAKGYYDNRYYPLKEINEVSDQSKSTSNKVVGDLFYKIIPGLTLKMGGVYEYSSNNIKHYASENAAEIKQYVNLYSEVGTDGSIKFNLPKGGYNKTKVGTTTGYTLRAQLNYDKKLNEDHAINVITGAEIRKVTSELNGYANFGYSEQTLLQQPVDYNKILTGSWFNTLFPNNSLSYTDLFQKTFSDDRFASAYFNGVYGYKSKYMVSGSIRIDQSNLFGTDPKYRYKPLWSFGVAWNVDKEAFMENAVWINKLKLRISDGFNGNVSKASLPQILANYAQNLRTSPTSTGLNIQSLENSALRWEETSNFNTGLDFTLFNRISGSIDYYSKRSSDLLGNTAIDPTKGASFTTLNSAKINNKGLEISLNSDWLHRKGFNWNTGIAFSYNTSKVLNVYQNNLKLNYQYVDGSNANNYIVGYPVGAMFSFRFAGLNQRGLPTVYDKNGNTKELYANTNDEGINDLNYSGNGVPPYAIGISNRFDIGPFYLYAMVDLYTGFKTRIPRPSIFSNRPLEGAENYFRTAGDEANTDVLGFYAFSNMDITRTFAVYDNSDKYVVNGSYILLRDVTLSYRFKNQVFKQLGFSNFELKAQGSNLFTKGFNKYNYSLATGNYARRNLVPTFTIGLFTNF
ncbi:SusC/RagA family TonB-linked outer membrane protein [Pedobacter africanus]|nr:SusC/RagA family TonB-linked outer membrane protein [Pedobacter africanus]